MIAPPLYNRLQTTFARPIACGVTICAAMRASSNGESWAGTDHMPIKRRLVLPPAMALPRAGG
jgi:hypothetical protein